MALRAVFFDVGETLVDEEAILASPRRGDRRRPSRALGGARRHDCARGGSHGAVAAPRDRATRDVGRIDVRELRPLSGCDRRASSVSGRRDSSSASSGTRRAHSSAGPGRKQLPADYISSSASWGVRKPAPAFFDRIVATAGHPPGEIAYVGDRVDNDVIPAAAAGLVAVHLRRGPWGRLQDASGHAPCRSRRSRSCLPR